MEDVSKKQSIYVAEHPDDHQGSVRVVQYLEGLKRFQVIWNLVTKAFGMVSRKETWIDPNQAKEKKKICITDAKENLQTAANNLSELIGKISTLHGSMQLDIITGSMSGTTAVAVYETLLNGLVFVIDYFNYIEKPELLDKIIMSQLSDKLIEGFFGKLTERTQGKNLRMGDMARRITNCAFTYMLGHIATKDQDAGGVSFKRSRSGTAETYMYTHDEIKDDQGMLWKLFNIRHEELFTVSDLWRCQSNEDDGKDVSQKLSDKMMFIGTYHGCQELTDVYGRRGSKEDLSKLNAVARVLKASPMKTVRDFQRRQFGTPPTLLGVHYQRATHQLNSDNNALVQISLLEQEHSHMGIEAEETEEHVQPDIQLQGMTIEGEETSSMVLKKGQLIAFRGCEGYCFNAIGLTADIDLQKVTPRKKVKRNILTLYSEDDVIVFQREEQWKGGNMLFAHILRTESDEIVQLNASKYATENRTFFALDKPAYDKVCEIAAAFEESITSEYEKTIEIEENNTSGCEDDPEEEAQDNQEVNVERRQRRTRGN